ncbi:MAG: sigma-70 family RNA polymerase sigma factor [Bacteroidota bacterium]
MSNNHNIHKHLIEQSQRGDQQAMKALYSAYAHAMYNICRRMMGEEEEAKDVLQDAFVDVFDKLGTLRDVGMFSSWIKRIVVNRCINAIRKKKIEIEEISESMVVPAEEESNFDYTNFQAAQVLSAIDKLPKGCRTVLSLYLFEGYDHKEIGEILGVSESASKAQYCKAKGKIRVMLGNESKRVG